MNRPPRFPVLLGLSHVALTWERLWPVLWPAVAVVSVFVSLSLIDVLPHLPGLVHILVLAAFAGALGVAVHYLITGFRAPRHGEARHRLERDNDLRHRPLTALVDRLSAGDDDPQAVALWIAHRARMASTARHLGVRFPAPGLMRRDPYGLRAVVLLFFIIAIAAGHGDPASRLGRAMVPQFGGTTGILLSVEAWITPPAYTGLPPLFLEPPAPGVDGDAEMKPIDVPVGSAILAQTSGTDRTPTLDIGDRRIPFVAVGAAGGGPASHRIEAVIEGGDRLAVMAGGQVLAAWPLRVIPDRPPVAAFTAAPARTARAHLRLDYEATDDYGLTELHAVIRRAGDSAGLPKEELSENRAEIRFRLPLPRRGNGETKGQGVRNLTAHPWAGLPVEMHLLAIDGHGQSGNSGNVPMILPERIFNHPVARAIIEQRKKLAASPAMRDLVSIAEALESINARPHLFFHDTVVYLAVRVAASRLRHDARSAAVASVQKLLWDTVLRIEDGEVSIAERELRAAQERLMQALREGADSAEIDRLMDDLQRHLDQYMAALAKQMEREGVSQMPLSPSAQRISREELQRMIDAARKLARTGARQAAGDLLAQLRKMLESIRAGMPEGGMGKEAAEARRMLDGLRGLTKRQQDLLDQNFQRLHQRQGGPRDGAGERGRAPNASPTPGDADAAMQNAVRRGLGDLMLQLGEFLGGVPKPLGQAERAMRDAARALSKDDLETAVPAQTKALENLRKAAEGAAEQLARRLGGMAGMAGQPTSRRPGKGRDPFGRSSGGAFGGSLGSQVTVPSEMEARRAHEILRELRRRAGEIDRPQIERQYIDRLLRLF